MFDSGYVQTHGTQHLGSPSSLSSSNRRFGKNSSEDVLASSGYSSSTARNKNRVDESVWNGSPISGVVQKPQSSSYRPPLNQPTASSRASVMSSSSAAPKARQPEKKYLRAEAAERPNRRNYNDEEDEDFDLNDESFMDDGYPEILTAPSDIDTDEFDDALMDIPAVFLEEADGGSEKDLDDEKVDSRPDQGGISTDKDRIDEYQDRWVGSERVESSKEAQRGSSIDYFSPGSSRRSCVSDDRGQERTSADDGWNSSSPGNLLGRSGRQTTAPGSNGTYVQERRNGSSVRGYYDDEMSEVGQLRRTDSVDSTMSYDRRDLEQHSRPGSERGSRGSPGSSFGIPDTSNRATIGSRCRETYAGADDQDSPAMDTNFSMVADGRSSFFRGSSMDSPLSSSREGNRGSSPSRMEAGTFASPSESRRPRTERGRSSYFSSLPEDTSIAAISHIAACQRSLQDGVDMDDFDRPRVRDADGNDEEVRPRANFQVIATFVRQQGRTGGAIFDVDTGIMHFLPSVADPAPDFAALRKILCQEHPGVVFISSRTPQDFVAKLRSILYDADGMPSGEQDNADQDLVFGSTFLEMKPNNDFNYSGCLQRLMSLKMDGRGGKTYLRTIIDAEDSCTVRACGAMLKHVSDSGLGPVTDVVALKIDYALTFDPFLLSSLDIFNADQHPSVAFKSSTKREGVSIYSLLNRCKSTVGSKFLKSVLSRPTRDISELKERLTMIQCLTQPRHAEIRGALASNCRYLRPLKMVLERMGDYQASPRFWRNFSKTLLHLVMLGQLCKSLPADIKLFGDLAGSVTARLQFLVGVLDKIVDHESSRQNNRFTVRPGLDTTLDEMRRCYEGLGDFLGRVSHQQLDLLPEVIEECSLTYVPQIGFLVSVDEGSVTAPNCDDDTRTVRSEISPSLCSVAPKALLEFPELELFFRADGKVFYKSEFCGQLDVGVGDVLIMIIDLEVSVMMALTEDIMTSAEEIHRLARLCSELDCYVGLADAALEYNLVKPDMILDPRSHVLDIVNGRHLLQEKCGTSGAFVPNSIRSGSLTNGRRDDDQGKIHILTGPNASGKSVLLKQVGLIVYLAHVGCFVPAEAARISVCDGIFSRIKSSESLVSGMSSFMAEASQMAFALRNSSGASLLLIDEFGRGTRADDGACLLSAVVDSLAARGQAECPHTFLATHFHELKEMLDDDSDQRNSMVKFCRMEFMVSNDDIVYLYQLVPGRAKRSFPEFVALSIGIHRAIIDRSRQIAELNAEGRAIGAVSFIIDRAAGENDEDLCRGCDEESREEEREVLLKAEFFGDSNVDSPCFSFDDLLLGVRESAN